MRHVPGFDQGCRGYEGKSMGYGRAINVHLWPHKQAFTGL